MRKTAAITAGCDWRQLRFQVCCVRPSSVSQAEAVPDASDVVQATSVRSKLPRRPAGRRFHYVLADCSRHYVTLTSLPVFPGLLLVYVRFTSGLITWCLFLSEHVTGQLRLYGTIKQAKKILLQFAHNVALVRASLTRLVGWQTDQQRTGRCSDCQMILTFDVTLKIGEVSLNVYVWSHGKLNSR